jgi:hypothetical protein
MADTRKPKTKPGPTGKGQPGRGSGAGTAAKARRQPDKGKLARGAAARRLEEKRRRQRTILWSAVAVVSVLALIGLIVFMGREEPQAENRPVAEEARDHIQPSEQPDNWNSNPPTSGDHLATPLPPGVYDSDQDMRALVHNLEHGYVVILYKGIPKDGLDQLETFVEDRDGSKLVLAPWSGLESNGVALAAWQNLETMQRVNMDVVQAFVNDYMVPVATRLTAPEPNAA